MTKLTRAQAQAATYAADLNQHLFPLVGYRLSTVKALAYRAAGYSPQEAAEAIDNATTDSRGWDC